MILSIIGTSFTGGGFTPVTFVASTYITLTNNTITFTISGITGVSEGTLLYWWIDGTSAGYSRADQFNEGIDNDTLELYTESGTLGATFTLTPIARGITFNIYIGYTLYNGFLNLPSDIVVGK